MTVGRAPAQADHAEQAPAPGLPASSLLRVFLRSLLLQASWNRRGMQNLGFAYALAPALARLHTDPAGRSRALERHLGFFNCHPYMAAAILGGALRAEELAARGAGAETAAVPYKAALQGPFAAIGDGFFWTALRPAAAMAAVASALWIGPWSVIVFLCAYNAVHLGLRGTFFLWGYRRGEEVIDAVGSMRLPAAAAVLRMVVALLCGAVASAWIAHQLAAGDGVGAAVMAGAALVGYAALRLGAGLYALLYGGLALGAGVGWYVWS